MTNISKFLCFHSLKAYVLKGCVWHTGVTAEFTASIGALLMNLINNVFACNFMFSVFLFYENSEEILIVKIVY